MGHITNSSRLISTYLYQNAETLFKDMTSNEHKLVFMTNKYGM